LAWAKAAATLDGAVPPRTSRAATEDELSGKVPTGHAAPLPTDSPPTLN